MPLWAEITASVLIVLAGLLSLLGSWGLIRFNNFKTRIHAPTITSSLGLICMLIASFLSSYFLQQRVLFHEILIIVFIFLTSPMTSMLLIRSYILRIEGINSAGSHSNL
ncbi:monovalent cation/H(+) antiporter subunit G [Brackiella oedipodis]|uniref:monovalent cation/H(+) antiporter subunit G n=1 Tax=Brackiella oedipodis TaxID=124225 RepID=UPI000689106A|nr:monovalent cation/H(+) antiporter subunit G [Brackiella oedipodis]